MISRNVCVSESG